MPFYFSTISRNTQFTQLYLLKNTTRKWYIYFITISVLMNHLIYQYCNVWTQHYTEHRNTNYLAQCSKLKLRAVLLIYFAYYTLNLMFGRSHCTHKRTWVEDLQKTHLRSRRNHSSSTQNHTNMTARVCVCVFISSPATGKDWESFI